MKKHVFMLAALTFFALLFSAALPADALTDDVLFRENQQSFNSRYFAKIDDGNIWVREKASDSWQQLELPEGLAGQVTELAMDDEHIIALNNVRQIYTMWNGLDEISKFKWQMEWGIPFWRGPGMKLRSDIKTWDFSVVSPREDKNWTDPAGHEFAVGLAKCSHIWMLGENGQELIYNDPWLPTDYSYGICGPERGAFRRSTSAPAVPTSS